MGTYRIMTLAKSVTIERNVKKKHSSARRTNTFNIYLINRNLNADNTQD